jgi:very-short-patch-repair endonuclease
VGVDPRVKLLRQNATKAKTLLWHQLRRKRVGDLRFRRQYRIGRYIVDFVCLPARLVVEVDGDSHDLTFEQDERRTRWLEREGVRVIRFWNRDVMNDLDSAVRTIEAELSAAVHRTRSNS